MRGEHPLTGGGGKPFVGSSPRARGAFHRPRRGEGWARLIPACAGSIYQVYGTITEVQAHPRVRGEHFSSVIQPPARSGSSPRARGACVPLPAAHLHGGLIPACAGSMSGGRSGSRSRRAHPRVRGEHPDSRGIVHARDGSSPRARGACAQRADRVHPSGLIPACAGSIAAEGRGATLLGAHPRVRGEHGEHVGVGVALVGSSPRARGAFAGADHGEHGIGLIPACAGSIVLCHG